MKLKDVAIIRFRNEQGQALTGVVAGVTDKGLGVLVDDAEAAPLILTNIRLHIGRGLDPIRVYDPEMAELVFVQPEDVLAIVVEDQLAISEIMERWKEG